MSKLFGNDYDGRKAIQIFEGTLMYFPKALAAVAAVSYAGNEQHNKGQPLHWARGKSMDQYNTALRHLMDHRMGGGRADPAAPENNGWVMEPKDTDGVRHLAKAAWRVLAALELSIEDEEAAAAIPKIGIRDATQPLPSDVGISPCACGARLFTCRSGELPPSVVSNGKHHTVTGCARV